MKPSGTDATMLARPSSRPVKTEPSSDPPGIADPLTGQVIGDTYRIEGIIAQGGMGRLYDAKHLRLDRPYAIKVILEPYTQIPSVIARFDREAIAMSRIRSPHVVDVVDVLRAPDGRPAIVFEKLEGEDLEQRLVRDGRLALPDAVRIARQICQGLAAAHEKGVVHRDVKPANLFLVQTEDGAPHVKILDFGVAKLLEDAQLTAAGGVVGTPAYMAPEQARSSASVDARTDVYGVGAVLYRMATGRLPYVDKDATAVLASLLEREPTRPTTIERSIPIGLEAIIQRAMARDREARPQTILDLDEELAGYEATLPNNKALATNARGARAEDLARRARWLRPLSIAWVLPIFAVVTLAIAAPLATFFVQLSGASQIADGERILVAVIGGIGGLVAAVLYVRGLVRAFSSGPAVSALLSRTSRAVLAGASGLGVLELARHVWAFVANSPVDASPIFGASLVLVALLFGVLVFARSKR